MKRILISFTLSILLIVFVASFSIISVELNLISLKTSYLFGIPVRFPVIIYLDILGFDVPESNLSGILITISLMLSVVVFYALIFFGLLTIRNKSKNKQVFEKIDNPPEPPVFDF